ncbi:MAG TPA: DNA polymerase ligase N-terminal domain-containing protein [Streptosporangiaceae bacterium]|nr:DNA polymerase ligase N-terminal domain-containing protein [Streptosporangiaceae bacterium]
MTASSDHGRLAAYQRKRDFGRTPEPAGDQPAPGSAPRSAPGSAPEDGPRFVVQRHRARRLHYDLRFEMDGVLVSWAVPKGPTLDPDVKRIAIHVEDHPIEYLNFEGVIPAGGYGGGDVIVWDRGTWAPHETDDPVQAVADGELHVDVTGEKLRGRLILVRSGPANGTGGAGGAGQEQWLLLHKHDADAVPGWNPEDHPESVLSGRTSDEVKAHPDRMWRSDLPAAEASVPVEPPPARARKRASGKAAKPVTIDRRPDELSKLDGLGPAGSLDVFGRRVRLTNLDKVLFPARPGEEPVTKRELIRYTIQVAPVVLPYLAGRPLNMHRFPGGAQTAGFWQKALPEHAPGWIGRWDNPEADRGKAHTYLVVDEPAALIWAANFGALEWHAWTARAADPSRPTYALIDIDPGTGTSWDEVLVLARLHRAALDHLGVLGRPKLTGRRGIQVWIPIAPGPGSDGTRAWVEELSRSIGSVVPELVSWKWDVSERGGRARLDYTQNVSHKTLVAPYSPRAAAGAPISAPLEWDDLDDPGLRPDSVTIRTAIDRLARRGDPFRALLDCDQELPPIS